MFDRKDKGTPGSGSGSNGGAGFSFIGEDVAIDGDIKSPASFHVDGAVTGDIACAALTLGEKGRVTGNIAAETAQLAGLVEGSIRVRQLTLDKTARITGDVGYETLSMAAGSRVDGRLSPDGGAPVEKKADGLPAATGPKLIAAS